MREANGIRWRVALGAVLALVVTLVTPVVDATVGPTSAAAADLSQFQPGDIIDDGLFYNGAALTASEVQQFLDGKAPKCQSGYTCLKSYRMDTSSKPADQMCAGYVGMAYESAADVIAKVGASCGISQKVLLVMLQKEQGLVTHSAPSMQRYRAAMGQGCPDTSDCDVAYYGFFNQVYGAARQLRRYENPPGTSQFFTWYAPGKTWNVRYHPDASCGTAPVFIKNKATAALYYYTPYQPNAAAIGAAYGTGDKCSSYGNRNFFNYYSDWFTSVRGWEAGSYFRDYYGVNQAWLGAAIGPMICGSPDGGCTQKFQGGMVASSTHSYAAGVRTEFLPTWQNYGREAAGLRYPISEKRCDDMREACRQEFQGGWIVAGAAIGHRVVFDDFRVAWSNWGREFGAMGLPSADVACAAGICIQEFEHASMLQSPAYGIQVVPAVVMRTWNDWGGRDGPLGLPVAGPTVPGGTDYAQEFQGGVVTVTNNAGAVTSTVDPWLNALVTSPWLGAQAGSKSCSLGSGGCYQPFAAGWIVQSSVGVAAVPEVVRGVWANWGREYGILGFPVGAPSANPDSGNYTQAFQGGVVTVTNNAGAVSSTTDPWFSVSLTSPWLGAQAGSKSCSLGSGGCYQPFAAGWIVQSSVGVAAVPEVVRGVWANWGREYGILGFPVGAPSANPDSGNYTQAFQGGVVTVTDGVAAVGVLPR